MDWMLIAATFLNVIFVMIAVQALKTYVMPFLKEKYPWVLPILTTVMGPLIVMLTNWLSAIIGHPIDFSEIIGVFTGIGAVAIYTASRAAYKKAG